MVEFKGDDREKMTISFLDFLAKLIENPSFLFITILISAVILVNGWTDAPNTIATAISTRSIRPKRALLLAEICNFFGVLVMTLINAKVAQTIFNIVNFGDNAQHSLIALCAALVSIVLWAVFAWLFGIPTSESHALVAGLSGSAIALTKSVSAISGQEWLKVIYGLVVATFLGFILGYLITKLIEFVFKNVDRRKTTSPFKYSQILGAGAMSFMHGAQDGQKFMGVFLLALALANGQTNVTNFEIPIWLMIYCSLIMTLGTSIGGYKIIKKVGMKMTKLEPYQGTATDFASAATLLVASSFGLPTSTTHAKTTAIMGVGASKRLSNVNWGVVREMVITWILTFPGCGLLGYLVTLLFMKVFI